MQNRRNFIRTAALSAFGAGLTTDIAKPQISTSTVQEVPSIVEYRKFGKTGFMISDISSGNPSSEGVLRALLKSGVNLIDTGEAYGNGNSELLIGTVLKDVDRSSVFINSKLYTEKSFPSKEDVIARTNKCLERLGTDYVDCMQIHSAENSTILKDEAFHSAMEQLKKEGKVRYVGVSCHGSNWAYNTEESLDKILLTAIDDGRFDVILLAYNFVNAEMAEKVLDACEQKNIATMIMKSNPVYIFNMLDERMKGLVAEGKEPDEYMQAFYSKYKLMDEQAAAFFKNYGIIDEKEISDAASKFVLSNPKAHTTIWDFRNFNDVQQMLGLSGKKLTVRDTALLRGYLNHLGPYNCRLGCNLCESVCPQHMPVNTILRYNYYFSSKKQEKRGITYYKRLKKPQPSEVCATCEGYCEKACPYGVSTRTLLAMAQNNLEVRV